MSQIWFSYNGEKIIAKKQSVRFLQTWSFSEENVEKTTVSHLVQLLWVNIFSKNDRVSDFSRHSRFQSKMLKKWLSYFYPKKLGMTPPYITGRDVPAPKPSNGTPTKLMTVLSSLSFKLLNKLKIENLKICENFT